MFESKREKTPFNITLEHLIKYSKCPRRSYLEWFDKEEENPITYIDAIKNTIKYCYIIYTKKEVPPTWNEVRNYIFYQIRNLTEKIEEDIEIVSCVQSFYETWILGNLDQPCVPGLTNFPIMLKVGLNRNFTTTLDIVSTFNNKVYIYDFIDLTNLDKDEKGYTKYRLYSDPAVYLKAYVFSVFSQIKPTNFIRYCIHLNRIVPININLLDETIKKAENMYRHLTNGLIKHLYYPVYSDHCLNCRLYKKCFF